ncbi:MAG: hypothetical protein V4631_00380 [Pseudomonadota bacterium]
MNIDDNPDPALAAPLAALRAAMAPMHAPRGVEKELMDAFARQFPPRRWYHSLTRAQWGVAGGVGSTAVVALLALTLSLHAPGPGLDGLPGAGIVDGGDFIALESAERIAQEANPHLLQTEVPRTALASLGVPVSPENAGDSVRAELLVGADGSPLALRLVSLP